VSLLTCPFAGLLKNNVWTAKRDVVCVVTNSKCESKYVFIFILYLPSVFSFQNHADIWEKRPHKSTSQAARSLRFQNIKICLMRQMC